MHDNDFPGAFFFHSWEVAERFPLLWGNVFHPQLFLPGDTVMDLLKGISLT